MTKKIICPRCKGNGYLKVKKEVQWPQKEEIIVVQCPMCNSEGEIEDVDISKYKSLAVSHDCYDKIGKIAKNIAPGVTLSRAQTVKVLVDEKVKKLNGKLTKSISKGS